MTSPAIPRPFTPPRRLPWRTRIAIAIAVAVLGAVGWFVATHEWGTTPGPLSGDVTESLSIPREAGQTWVFGNAVTVNLGDRPAVLRRIALVDPTPGLRVIDTKVSGAKRKFLATATEGAWPTKKYQDVHSVSGFTVAPRGQPTGERGVELLFVLRADKPGRYEAPGVLVDYTVDGKEHRRFLPFAIGVCVHAVGQPKDGNCQPPKIVTADELRQLG